MNRFGFLAGIKVLQLSQSAGNAAASPKTPSSVTIQFSDLDGNPVSKAVDLRVRLTTADYDLSTHGTYAVGANTVLVETIAGTVKDAIIRTHTNGKATITVTNETADENMNVRIGPALINSLPGDYTAFRQFSHSAV